MVQASSAPHGWVNFTRRSSSARASKAERPSGLKLAGCAAPPAFVDAPPDQKLGDHVELRNRRPGQVDGAALRLAQGIAGLGLEVGFAYEAVGQGGRERRRPHAFVAEVRGIHVE